MVTRLASWWCRRWHIDRNHPRPDICEICARFQALRQAVGRHRGDRST